MPIQTARVDCFASTSPPRSGCAFAPQTPDLILPRSTTDPRGVQHHGIVVPCHTQFAYAFSKSPQRSDRKHPRPQTPRPDFTPQTPGSVHTSRVRCSTRGLTESEITISRRQTSDSQPLRCQTPARRFFAPPNVCWRLEIVISESVSPRVERLTRDV